MLRLRCLGFRLQGLGLCLDGGAGVELWALSLNFKATTLQDLGTLARRRFKMQNYSKQGLYCSSTCLSWRRPQLLEGTCTERVSNPDLQSPCASRSTAPPFQECSAFPIPKQPEFLNRAVATVAVAFQEKDPVRSSEHPEARERSEPKPIA